MPSLQIQDIPADLYETLALTAEREKRSLSEQAVFVLRSFFTAKDKSFAQINPTYSDAKPEYWAEIDRRKRDIEAGNGLTFDFDDLVSFTDGTIGKEELLSRAL